MYNSQILFGLFSVSYKSNIRVSNCLNNIGFKPINSFDKLINYGRFNRNCNKIFIPNIKTMSEYNGIKRNGHMIHIIDPYKLMQLSNNFEPTSHNINQLEFDFYIIDEYDNDNITNQLHNIIDMIKE